MTNRQIRTVLEGGSYVEGPRWHEGTLVGVGLLPAHGEHGDH